MNKSKDPTINRQSLQAILKVGQQIQNFKTETEDQTRKRLREIKQMEKTQFEPVYTKKQYLEAVSKLQEQITKVLQEKNQMKNNHKKIIDQLTQKLENSQKEIKNEECKTKKAIQDMNRQRQSAQSYKQKYNLSQQKVNSNMDVISKLKEKNQNTIVQFKNKLTSLQKSNHLQQFCTEKQIQSLVQKQKIYEELICRNDNYEGKRLIDYIGLCNEKELDIQKMLLSMTQKEEFYRNHVETIKKEHEEEKNTIDFFAAQCDKIEDKIKISLKIQDDIVVTVDKLIQENQRLNKKIQSYKNIEQKVKQSQQKIQDYSRKMQEIISRLKPNPSANSDMEKFNLYNSSEQQNQKLRLKIKQLQDKLQQANKRSYMSREDYEKLQNIVIIHCQKTDQQLRSLKNNQYNSIRLSQNIQNSTGNIASTLFSEEKKSDQNHSDYKFQFFEFQKEQSNDSLIKAIQKFQNKSIAEFTPLFTSSRSARDNFSDKLPSQGSLLLVFKLLGSFLGVFSSQFNQHKGNSGELFMFTLDSKKDQNIRTFLKKQGASEQLNRMVFRENSLVIGQNELILMNNSQEKAFSLNCRGVRPTYFLLNPKQLAIEGQMTDNKIKYEKLAIYRVYFY